MTELHKVLNETHKALAYMASKIAGLHAILAKDEQSSLPDNVYRLMLLNNLAGMNALRDYLVGREMFDDDDEAVTGPAYDHGELTLLSESDDLSETYRKNYVTGKVNP